MQPDEDKFMNAVIMHEKSWGDERYKGRPTLKQILESPVVAFWYPTGKELGHTITIHGDMKDVDRYVTALVLHTTKEPPRLRLAAVFRDRKRVKIRAVNVVYQE